MRILRNALGAFQTNCYLVEHAGETTIIDPGDGALGFIARHVEETGSSPRAVVLTHRHLDHMRDAGELQHRFDIPVFVHQADDFMLRSGGGVPPSFAVMLHGDSMRTVEWSTPLGATVPIGGEPFEVWHAPGHSPGSVLLVGEEVVFVGDVVMAGTIGRTDLPDSSPGDMVATLSGPVARLPRRLRLLPGHGPESTVAREHDRNPFIREAMRR